MQPVFFLLECVVTPREDKPSGNTKKVLITEIPDDEIENIEAGETGRSDEDDEDPYAVSYLAVLRTCHSSNKRSRVPGFITFTAILTPGDGEIK